MEGKKKFTYEEHLQEFKNIVQKLRSEELELTDALALVNEGKKYYEECISKLDEMEEELEVFVRT